MPADAQVALKATIYIPSAPTTKVKLAAQEIRRYFYLRTGTLAAIQQISRDITLSRTSFLLIPGVERLVEFPEIPILASSMRQLEQEGYLLKIISHEGKTIYVIAGFDDTGLLYGAYAFAEQMGIRFYLDGDVVPDVKLDPKNCAVKEKVGKPLFSIRGIQPFHDFPEGPDWWTADDYKSVLSQLPKLKMNFIGLHTYPEGGVGPEPLVWIGLEEDIDSRGDVKKSYRARHFTNVNGTWGYVKRPTYAYWNKMGELYAEEIAGASYMKGIVEWPVEPQAQNALFDKTAGFFSEVLRYAKELSIHTCIGTETPLVIPAQVKAALAAKGITPDDSATTQRLYEGMFEWVKQHYPIDYYWFWTPEDWTWRLNTPEELARTRMDLESAQRAAKKVNAPFTLATCGWVLGPASDRSAFDQFLPKSWPMSCINRYVGFEPIEADFAKTTGRPLWAIPWLEDDPGLTVPQLWAGRMRRDAIDAAANGCTGLIGIHWRTHILGPNVSALAFAGWDQPWNPRLGMKASSDDAIARKKIMNLDYPVDDFYRDWAKCNFGGESFDAISQIFSKLDGGPAFVPNAAYTTWLPRPADWVDGPGGIKADTLVWREREKDYDFVDQLERLRNSITGAGNQDRFDYWLNMFKYLKAVGRFACSQGEINRLIQKAEKAPEPERVQFWDVFVSLRKQQIADLEAVTTWLIKSVRSKGELGTVANWQQHIRDITLERSAAAMQKLTGQSLPRECWPLDTELNVHRMIVPTVRTALRKGEALNLEVLFYGVRPKTVEIKLRRLGQGVFETFPFRHVARNVYEVLVPAERIQEDFEYVVSAEGNDGTRYQFPATASTMNQTVVVY